MENIYDLIITNINNFKEISLIINILLIVIESIIPPLPLALFITILYTNYGPLLGFIISWISTVIGCLISFYLSQKHLKKYTDNHIRNHKYANNLLKIVDKMKFSNLVLLISIPFTPAFAINIVSGISNMHIKKFLPAILVGKIFMVLFWGYIGTTLLEAIKNPIVLIKILLLLLISYILSKIVNKKFKLD